VSFDFEQVVCRFAIVQILTFEDTNIGWITWLFLTQVIIAEITSCLSMFKPYNITRVDKLADILWLLLAIVDNLPFVKVLRAIGFQLFEELVRILPSFWGPRSVLRRVVLDSDLVLQVLLRDMQIAVVFLVVKQDVVIEYYCLSVKTVFVPLLDVECHSLR